MNDGLEIADAQRSATDVLMAKNIADKLLQHYPNYLWAVSVEKGLITVKNMNLSGQWGFRMKVAPIYSASDLDKQVIRAGGEILEHYRMSRARMAGGKVNERLMDLKTDFAGRTAFDK